MRLKVATLIAVVVTPIATGTSPAVQTAIARPATHGRLSRRRGAFPLLAAVVALACAPAAQATFPGRDGQLLLGGGQNELSVGPCMDIRIGSSRCTSTAWAAKPM
jgi:hypothetical protein